MKKIIAILSLVIILTNISSAQQKTPSAKPRLIVNIVVEGMRYEYLYKYWDKFGEGGFKRLVNSGFLSKNAEYNYLFTESASGYATIATGANPSQNGIIGESWFQRLKNSEMYCVFDPKVIPLGYNEIKDENKVSPDNLMVTTFTDELKLSNFKQSKVFGISPKDYAAIIPAGHLADGAFWFDKKTGNWVSSSYYMQNLPEWVERFNNKKFTDIYLSKIWEPYLKITEYTEALGDNSMHEKGLLGKYRTFPYNLAALKAEWGNFDILNFTPFGNTYTKDFAISAIVNEELGKDNYCDFLNIGFTANANIANAFGIRSVELEDVYIRMDRDLQHFIGFIEDYVGVQNTLIILTSDRGDSDDVDFLQSINMPAKYFNDNSAMYLLGSYLRSIFKNNNIIQKQYGSRIYLNRYAIEDAKLNLNEIQNSICNFMIDLSGVSNVINSNDLEGRNYTEGMLKKAQNSYQQKRSPDIFLIFESGVVPKDEKNFSSGYKHNSHVPLIFFGWKVKPAHSSEAIDITDIAPSLSAALNIAQPGAATGKIIQNLFKD